MSFQSREELEAFYAEQRKKMFGGSTKVKKHKRKGTKGVKAHVRSTSKKVTKVIPTTVDDKAVKEVMGLYDELDEMVKSLVLSGDSDEQEWIKDYINELKINISKFPDHIQKRAKALRKI